MLWKKCEPMKLRDFRLLARIFCPEWHNDQSTLCNKLRAASLCKPSVCLFVRLREQKACGLESVPCPSTQVHMRNGPCSSDMHIAVLFFHLCPALICVLAS